MITHTIRIARCACMAFYRGELEGRSVIIRGERYRFREVILSDAPDHNPELIAHRCHFFIDNDLAILEEVLLSVIRQDIQADSKGSITLLNADVQYAHPYNHKGLLWHDTHWCTANPPLHARGLIKRLKGMLENMEAGERHEWLCRMVAPMRDLSASAHIPKQAAIALALALRRE